MVQTVEEAQVLFSASGMGKVETAAGRANRTMSRMTSIAGRATSAIRGIGRAATSFRGIASIAALGYSIKQASDAASEQIAAERKLESVLAATGNAAGFTADELKQMAADLQRVTNYGDEATISAMGVMASFTNISGDVFQGAVVAAQDLSAVMGQDLQSSVVQIGKALNDPIKGVTALQRVGVAFTQQQRDQINALVASGNSMAAQQMILAELKKEFGGAAEAMADPFTQFGNAAGDVQEELGMLFRDIGTVLLPIGNDLLAWTSDAISGLRGYADEFQTFVTVAGNAFTSVQDSLENVGIAFGVFAGNIGDNWQSLFNDLQQWASTAFSWISDNAATMASNIATAVRNGSALIERAGMQLGEWAAYKLGFSDEMLEIPEAKMQEFAEFTPFESPDTPFVSSLADQVSDAISRREAERQAERMPEAPAAVVAAGGGGFVIPAAPVEIETEDVKTQRGSALQVFQRLQESFARKAADTAAKQLAEAQKGNAIAEEQLQIAKQQKPMGAILE